MNAFFSKSVSDNRRSAIQNPNWPGLLIITFVLVVAGLRLRRSKQQKLPA